MTHPTTLPPAFTPTTIPAVVEVNGVYPILEGVRQGQDNLLGGFGYLEWSWAGNAVHEGLDLNSRGGGDADLGALVVAPLDGVVTWTQLWDGRSNGFGTHLALFVDDARAAEPCYLHVAHLATLKTQPGQRVVAGQVLGTCGKSGNQPYAHLHLALWHDVPPGGWNFWQSGWSREQVAAHTVDPQKWFWASVTKAGQGMPGGGAAPPEEMAMLEDWQVLHWVMAPLWNLAGVPYNPEALTSKAWLQELRQGRYRGRPRTADRPYGEGDQAGHWAEFEDGVCVTRTDSGEWSWNG